MTDVIMTGTPYLFSMLSSRHLGLWTLHSFGSLHGFWSIGGSVERMPACGKDGWCVCVCVRGRIPATGCQGPGMDNLLVSG